MFSVTTADFRHSNFTEATTEINVDREEENKCWLIFIDTVSHSTANGIIYSVCVPDQ